MSGTTKLEDLHAAIRAGNQGWVLSLCEENILAIKASMGSLKARYDAIIDVRTGIPSQASYLQATWGFMRPHGIFSRTELEAAIKRAEPASEMHEVLKHVLATHRDEMRKCSSYKSYDPKNHPLSSRLAPRYKPASSSLAASRMVSRAHFDSVVGQLLSNQATLIEQNALLMKQMHEMQALLARSVSPSSTSASGGRTTTPDSM